MRTPARSTEAAVPTDHGQNISHLRRKIEHEMQVNISVAERSPLHQQRLEYLPRIPPLLSGAFRVEKGERTGAACDEEAIREHFPTLFGQPVVRLTPNRGGPLTIGRALRIGIVLSGGPAPGGHNVIAGVFDHLQQRNGDSQLIGFLDGPAGIVDKRYVLLQEDAVDACRNQGGFHLLGSGRTKIEKPEQFAASRAAAEELQLDGLVCVGGDDTNTNAMLLAEDFARHGLRTRVVGVPKTIDGDLRNEYIEASFGFDTAVKVYSELVANLGCDASSAKKCYHFVRLMGRSASHITLETALQTHPNLALIGEEIAEHGNTLTQVVTEISDLVVERHRIGKSYGMVLIPEGLIEFMPDMRELIQSLNDSLAAVTAERHSASGSSLSAEDEEQVHGEAIRRLAEHERRLFMSLPESFQQQLLLDRDPHGNVQLSQMESERLLASMVGEQLRSRRQDAGGDFRGGKFVAIPHFFGYEGRCSLPTNFDCNYCYALGHTSAALIEAGCTGYVATVSGLTGAPERWRCGGYPLTVMMNMERRKGREVPVIRKALIATNEPAFRVFAQHRDHWRLTEDYRCPGPIQHFGHMSEQLNFTLVCNTNPAIAAAAASGDADAPPPTNGTVQATH